MNELEFYDGTDSEDAQGFRLIQATQPSHPYVGQWWPTGHGLGYEHVFTHQVVDLVTAIAAGRQPEPSFDDALQVQRVLDAVERSAATSRGSPRRPPDALSLLRAADLVERQRLRDRLERLAFGVDPEDLRDRPPMIMIAAPRK